ncbi:hypothetical protein GPECTOR_173g205 [Gonium pectorale]|uniref:Uncharacterized protein n=1 Tax=Gonium pectorale TaxID=33097 RepID=A0A150FXD0_GONPE|nr:hypothetical protein GPECTOR_173g205 [Gonium pectorale]|eukprot:KXZ42259.1 hypothetical protein GPECTOR_173g205 [Gonium pectorale]
MFYYAESSIGISISGGSVTFFYPRSLRDHSATINLITWRMVKAHGLPVRPTTKRLSTGADQVEVTHELAHEQLSVCLLPGSRHAVRLPMTETLVVKDTPLFDFLASNPQMHVVADFVTTYPVPQLHFRPNVLEHPELLVTILMRNAPGVRPAAVNCFAACCTSFSESTDAKLGGDVTAPASLSSSRAAAPARSSR